MRTLYFRRVFPTFSVASTCLFSCSVFRMSSTEASAYTPPKVWKASENAGNKFAAVNRPTAGARTEKELQVGKHPFQLYSMGTPNGQKVTILFEELLEAGVKEAEYDAWLVDIMSQDQFTSGFVAANPNSKIPALMDYSRGKDHPVRVFESGSILLHLAEKFGMFLPSEIRTEVLNWLFWQMGAAPYVGGGFGHFFKYADEKQEYPINRFTMETKRQLDVLNNQLKERKFIAGDQYTIADIAIFPWYGKLITGQIYGEDAATFLGGAEEYPHVMRWAKEIEARPAVKRGLVVNRAWGDVQLPERHDASDFDKVTL